jgi:hypothetical protein
MILHYAPFICWPTHGAVLRPLKSAIPTNTYGVPLFLRRYFLSPESTASLNDAAFDKWRSELPSYIGEKCEQTLWSEVIRLEDRILNVRQMSTSLIQISRICKNLSRRTRVVIAVIDHLQIRI